MSTPMVIFNPAKQVILFLTVIAVFILNLVLTLQSRKQAGLILTWLAFRGTFANTQFQFCKQTKSHSERLLHLW